MSVDLTQPGAMGEGFHSPEGEPLPRDFLAPTAFLEVVSPDIWQLQPEDYDMVTPEMIAAADTKKLRPTLLPDKNKRTRAGDYVIDGVALSVQEYNLLPRNVDMFGDAAVNTARKRQKMPLNDQAQAATDERERLAAFRDRNTKITRYFNNGLSKECSRLYRLFEAATHPGSSVIDDRVIEGWQLHQDLIMTQGTFNNMLQVVGQRRGWSEQQYGWAKRAVEARLFLMREDSQYLMNWHTMLRLALDYNQERQRLFLDRHAKLEARLGAHE